MQQFGKRARRVLALVGAAGVGVLGCRGDVTSPAANKSAVAGVSRGPHKDLSLQQSGYYCRVLIVPNTATLKVGQALHYNIEALSCDGQADDVYDGSLGSWSTSNPSVAQIDGSGTLYASAQGSTYVNLYFAGQQDVAKVNVQAASAISTVQVTPNPLRISSGNSYQMTATVKDQYGAVLNVPVTWSTNASNLLTVDGNGVIHALHSGVAMVKATAGGVTGGAEIDIDAITFSILGPRSVRSAGVTSNYTVPNRAGVTYEWYINNPGTAGSYNFIGTGTSMSLTYGCSSNGDNELLVRARSTGGAQGQAYLLTSVQIPGGCN